MKKFLSLLYAAACVIGASGIAAGAPSLASMQLLMDDNASHPDA